jgi:transposase-like protein
MSFSEICQVNYLNNEVEQDHRFIKKFTLPMMGFNPRKAERISGSAG